MTEGSGTDIPLTIEELNAIDAAAHAAMADRAASFAAPVDLVLRLVRSHKAASVGAFIDEVASSDLTADLCEHIEALRNALRAVATIRADDDAGARRARRIARAALEESRAADDGLLLEFGNSVAELARYEAPEYLELPDPNVGDIWEDGLHGRYRVVEVDAAAGCVRVEVVQARPEWMDMGEFATFVHRVEPPAPDRYGGDAPADSDDDGDDDDEG